MPDTNGWSEYQKLVLSELERHNGLIEDIRNKLGKIETDIAMLKVKAGFWGALAGAIPVAIAMGLKYIGQ